MKKNDLDYDLRKLEFEKSLEIRNFEISNFWKRSWFFGALIIAIASGYYVIKKDNTIPPIILSFIGVLVSLAQSLMNRGSKYWQERWEYKTKNRESALKIDVTKTERYNEKEKYYIEQCIRGKNENYLSRSIRISVSKLIFLVWDIITISCFLIWLNDFIKYICDIIYQYQLYKKIIPYKAGIFQIIIILFIIKFIRHSKMYEVLAKKDINIKEIIKNYTHNNIEKL